MKYHYVNLGITGYRALSQPLTKRVTRKDAGDQRCPSLSYPEASSDYTGPTFERCVCSSLDGDENLPMKTATHT